MRWEEINDGDVDLFMWLLDDGFLVKGFRTDDGDPIAYRPAEIGGFSRIREIL